MLYCTNCFRSRTTHREIEAVWFVWVADWPIYHYLCDDCLLAALREGLPRTQLAIDPVPTEKYPVVQVQRIAAVQGRKLYEQQCTDRIHELERAQRQLEAAFDEFDQIVVIPGELPPHVDFTALEQAIRQMIGS